ncbi:MAG: zinc ribbon domain-containing protein, partial [Solobacterium sp.]|nr:zinc ribbon domain-containing protein [Solobacterium sp.]
EESEQFKHIMDGSYVNEEPIRSNTKEVKEEIPVLSDIQDWLKKWNLMEEEEKEEGIICTHCGNKNQEDAHYCIKCGKPLKVKTAIRFCGYCSEVLEGDEDYCPKCGKKVR